jgi:hypothetical protein
MADGGQIDKGDYVIIKESYGGGDGIVEDVMNNFAIVKTKEGKKSYHVSNLIGYSSKEEAAYDLGDDTYEDLQDFVDNEDHYANGGKLNIGTIKKTDTSVLFDKQSGKFYANVIDGLGNRINKLNVNTIDDLFEDYPTFRLNTTGEKEFPESMADGGKVKFDDKVKSIQASLLKRKKVAPSVQKDYGKTYNKAEAKKSAKRIVGAMTAKERLMAKKKK